MTHNADDVVVSASDIWAVFECADNQVSWSAKAWKARAQLRAAVYYKRLNDGGVSS